MTGLLRGRVTVVWGALVMATCVSWWLGTDHGLSSTDGTTVATALVLAIAFVKVHFIGAWFMEMRAAPVALRVVFEAWVFVVGAGVVALYVAA